MTAEPVRVDANPATSEPTSGLPDRDPPAGSLFQLFSGGGPASAPLQRNKQLAFFEPEANTEAEPPPGATTDQVRESGANAALSPQPHSELIKRLRVEVAARIQQEEQQAEKRRLRLRTWLLRAISLAALAAAAGALFEKLPNKISSTALMATVTSEPAVQRPESDQGNSTAPVASAEPSAPEKVSSTAPAPSVTLEPAVQPLESDQGTSTASVASAQPPAPEKVNSTAPAPSVTSEPAVQRPEKAQVASPAEPGRSPHSSSAARPHLSTEEVALLLARGDSLMSRSDVSSARPFYERAFVGGSTQAALRLGASYDPAFLSQAGVRGVRGDPALAAYWYQRAGDLAVVEGTRNGAAR